MTAADLTLADFRDAVDNLLAAHLLASTDGADLLDADTLADAIIDAIIDLDPAHAELGHVHPFHPSRLVRHDGVTMDLTLHVDHQQLTADEADSLGIEVHDIDLLDSDDVDTWTIDAWTWAVANSAGQIISSGGDAIGGPADMATLFEVVADWLAVAQP